MPGLFVSLRTWTTSRSALSERAGWVGGAPRRGLGDDRCARGVKATAVCSEQAIRTVGHREPTGPNASPLRNWVRSTWCSRVASLRQCADVATAGGSMRVPLARLGICDACMTQVGIGKFVARTGGASLKESRLSSGFSRIFRPRVSRYGTYAPRRSP